MIDFDVAQQQRVHQLRPGAVLDLEGDRYADPNHNDPRFEFEVYPVLTIEVETPNCIVLCDASETAVIGFPPDHVVTVVGFDEEVAQLGP